MAKAYKCDRCGKLFESKEFESRKVLGKPSIVLRRTYNASDIYDMDICNSCWEEFQGWWHIAMEEKEEEEEDGQ